MEGALKASFPLGPFHLKSPKRSFRRIVILRAFLGYPRVILGFLWGTFFFKYFIAFDKTVIKWVARKNDNWIF